MTPQQTEGNSTIDPRLPISGRVGQRAISMEHDDESMGQYLLSTSDPDPSAEDIALGYKNLLEADHEELKRLRVEKALTNLDADASDSGHDRSRAQP